MSQLELCLSPANDEVLKLYLQGQKTHVGDAGVDLYIPESIKIPANSLAFKINH